LQLPLPFLFVITKGNPASARAIAVVLFGCHSKANPALAIAVAIVLLVVIPNETLHLQELLQLSF
jgi:hypothetical protein